MIYFSIIVFLILGLGCGYFSYMHCETTRDSILFKIASFLWFLAAILRIAYLL